MADIREKVGQRIRELRREKGISQEKLALLIGIDRTYIASVEGGHRNISIINLSKSVFGNSFINNETFQQYLAMAI